MVDIEQRIDRIGCGNGTMTLRRYGHCHEGADSTTMTQLDSGSLVQYRLDVDTLDNFAE